MPFVPAAFGLGTMVYNGLELGSFFEIPKDSDCWQILMAVNPCLQATFTFMQMYFIFMNSRVCGSIRVVGIVSRAETASRTGVLRLKGCLRGVMRCSWSQCAGGMLRGGCRLLMRPYPRSSYVSDSDSAGSYVLFISHYVPRSQSRWCRDLPWFVATDDI